MKVKEKKPKKITLRERISNIFKEKEEEIKSSCCDKNMYLKVDLYVCSKCEKKNGHRYSLLL